MISDTQAQIEVFKKFPWKTLPLILVLVIANFLLREIKWDFFRRSAQIKVPRSGSFLIFFSGYSMAISPGRVGELIKPFMYKEYFGQKMRKTIPLVFCERISDLLGMIVLAIITVPFFMSAGNDPVNNSLTLLIYGFLIFAVVTMMAGILMVRNKKIVYFFLANLRKVRKLRGISRKIFHLYQSTYPLLTPKNLIIATSLASISWFFECIAMDLILKGVGAENLTLPQVTFIFCMSTIFGGFLFFLPGGLGGFEGASQKMLTMLGVAKHVATPAILITRFSTLFFAVALGFIFILITSLKYHKSINWNEFEKASEEPAD